MKFQPQLWKALSDSSIERLNLPRQETMPGIKEMLARSVQRLSEDLYSSQTHCIMELVQNADDNCRRRQPRTTLPLPHRATPNT